ncbi:hypothetical protein [Methylomonas fluvii]|uniref:Uncharacterized protein n=1 Tax=Methylomonas fluvii TaxID=1854564 RepID=A0ABR9DL72_9GAMM|nr:hypothetical protein [Methylomonas fluvii]MBD9363785.1 hypothetical protein [Methylomonas fluvii]
MVSSKGWDVKKTSRRKRRRLRSNQPQAIIAIDEIVAWMSTVSTPVLQASIKPYTGLSYKPLQLMTENTQTGLLTFMNAAIDEFAAENPIRVIAIRITQTMIFSDRVNLVTQNQTYLRLTKNGLHL